MKKALWFMGWIIVVVLLSGSSSVIVQNRLFLKVNDTLYYGTDEIGPMGDSGSIEGEINSSVEAEEIPTKNGSSNFGCIGNSYTYDFGDGFIMVLLEDKEWHCFYSHLYIKH